MKLLEKTNWNYLLISGIAFFIAGALIYFVLSFILKGQLNEKLMSDIEGVKRIIEKDGTLPYYYPFIEAREVPVQSVSSVRTIDTLIYNSTEKEDVPYRQISIISGTKEKKYFIAARDTLLEESDLLSTIAIVIGTVFILLLLALYLINRRLYLKIWKPFYKTLGELKEFSHDKSGFSLTPVNQPDEFAELNKTLEKLTQKVISDYQSLKRFTEDASHEIQTPLAVIQSKVETLMQYPDFTSDQVEIINSIYLYTQKISKLTQTLLLLTKIANDQFPEKEEVNISEIIRDKLEFFEDTIALKKLTLNKLIGQECTFETNIFLAESLIMNLIGNAVKHCITEGIINIELNNNQLVISNSGPPVMVPVSKLFDRFYKINKSSDSLGLGLSIVKEICKVNKWEISYEYSVDLHKFTVKF